MVNLLFLLLLLQSSSLLHQVAIETRLVSFLLLQVDAGYEATPIQLHLMLLFISKRKKIYIFFFTAMEIKN